MDNEMLKNLLWQFTDLCTTAGIKILIAVLVLFIGLKLTKIFTRFFKKNRAMSKMDVSIKGFLMNFLNIALKIVVIITAASIIGLPTASVITVVGSAGVAIGLALQGSLSNIAGGLILLLFKPFHVGDTILVEGETGTVTEIGIFYTKIITPDNRDVIFPNGVVSNEKMVNISANRTRRADFLYSVGYDSDIDQVKKILEECVRECEFVLDDPLPTIFLSEQADSALIFSVYAWCECDLYLNLRSDLTERVKKAFDANHIKIPYPQLDVHIEK